MDTPPSASITYITSQNSTSSTQVSVLVFVLRLYRKKSYLSLFLYVDQVMSPEDAVAQELGTDPGYYSTSPSQMQYNKPAGGGSTQQTTPQTPNTPSSIPDIILTGKVMSFEQTTYSLSHLFSWLIRFVTSYFLVILKSCTVMYSVSHVRIWEIFRRNVLLLLMVTSSIFLSQYSSKDQTADIFRVMEVKQTKWQIILAVTQPLFSICRS